MHIIIDEFYLPKNQTKTYIQRDLDSEGQGCERTTNRKSDSPHLCISAIHSQSKNNEAKYHLLYSQTKISRLVWQYAEFLEKYNR